ncbi:hypothetical protein HPP92_004447 [Vanilla planifolia]|uniref:Glycosyltransferase 61 catalytic domain-containing protein n=1 Tax=Vanilla planifolia TaxID=51239 RepID=A0A835RMT8_VANPL|nr:hypothetical protein HPP92_004447 [Vanilla planifolia]
MVDFTGFMRKAYALPRDAPISERELGIRKPRLLIISRNRTRRFTKIEKMVRTAGWLGSEVVVAEAGGNVAAFARVVNTCDVMVGVHGAGLTNLVFLPTKAVAIQVVPWGTWTDLEGPTWEPARSMNLRYLSTK